MYNHLISNDYSTSILNEFITYQFGSMCNGLKVVDAELVSYQIHLKLNSDRPSVTINWTYGGTNTLKCEPEYLHGDTDLIAMNKRNGYKLHYSKNNIDGIKTNILPAVDNLHLKMTPSFGFHTKFLFHLDMLSKSRGQLVLIHHNTRDTFADQFEMGRIRFANQTVTCYGNADLEVPAHHQGAKDNFVISLFWG